MYDLIDVYLKSNGRWVYIDMTRMFKTLVSARKWAVDFYGTENVKCEFACETIKG